MTVKPFSRLNYAPRNYNIIADTMVPVYNVSASSSSINEGTAVTYTITTQYVLDGTVLYWTTSGTTVAADFSDGVISGSVTMTDGTATVVRTLTSDVLTEGAETIVFELRTVSTSGTIVASTPSGTVNDVSVLTITPSTSSVNEGSSVTWTISAVGFGTGTLYYTNSGTTNASDFSDGLNSGSIAITADSGTLTKTLLNDLSTEGSETIIIQIRTGSTSGTVVGTSNTVTVADTSYSSQAYSVKFNGSSQYLSVPTTFNVRTTTSWTMEGWWYLNSTSNPILISGQTSGTDKFYIQLIGNFYVGDNTSNPITASYTFTTNNWYHIAVVNNNGTLNAYINGRLLQSVSNTLISNAITVWRIGSRNSGPYYINGNISNIRIVSGVAVYTDNFNPPTDNLSAITGTSLLINGATIADSSINSATITNNNTAIVTMENPFGDYSTYFPSGAGSNYVVPHSSSLDFGTGDFTIEFWMYAISMPNAAGIIGKKESDSTNGWQIYYNNTYATNRMSIRLTQQIDVTSTSSWTLNVWDHWAVTRSGTTVSWFKNGVLDSTATNSSDISEVRSVYIGYSETWGGYFTGYLSNIRVVKGSALYSSNFIPSTSALTAISGTSLLTCQYSEIMDASTNHATITAVVPRPNNQNPFGNYYASFNGSSQYLTVPSSAGFAFGTGDFTIEFWVYPTVNVRQDWFDLYLSSASSRLLIYYDGTNIIYYNYITAKITGSAMTLNAWQHIALVRLSGNTKLYINGTQSGSTATDTFSYIAQPLFIGKDGAGSTYVTGYITNVRVVKGVAVYTGTFTPPTTPLNNTQSSGTNISAITGTSTSLLTCQYANIVDASTNVLSITNNGSIKTYLSDLFSGIVSGVNYAQKNYSLSLNGSSQYVTTASSTAATGNFTVECWVYATAYTTNMGIWSIGSTEAAGRYELYLASSYTLTLDQYTAGGPTYGTISPNTWYHIALVRSGSTITIYITGTARSVTSGSATLSGTIGGTNGYVIGKTTYGPNAPWSGYISNFRYASVAVYTGAFTPSTTPLKAAQSSGTNIAAITTQTNILACQYNTLFDASNNKLALTKTGSPDMVNVYPFPA